MALEVLRHYEACLPVSTMLEARRSAGTAARHLGYAH